MRTVGIRYIAAYRTATRTALTLDVRRERARTLCVSLKTRAVTVSSLGNHASLPQTTRYLAISLRAVKNWPTNKQKMARVETAPNCVSSASVYILSWPPEPRRPAAAHFVTRLTFTSHVEHASVLRTRPMALRRACRRLSLSYP